MFDPAKYAHVTVVDRREVDPHLWVVRVRPDIELAFRPGQYITLGMPNNDHVIERPYSIASAPEEPEIELFLERVPGGELSEPLHRLKVGSELLVRKRPKGLFLKNAPVPDHAHLLVATVTGVAPYVSMLRVLAGQWRAGELPGAQQMTLLHGASSADELGYVEELRALDAECPWFRYVPTVSRPWDNPGWEGETGRVEDILRKYADGDGMEPGSSSVFTCGHPEMIHKTHQIMTRRGYSKESIHEEQYWPE